MSPEKPANTPLFSVIIPVHNRADRIARTLHSVWNQTFHNFEVIVVDDGSTDDLHTVLAAQTDERLRVIRQDNAGPATARNTGVAAAHGSYIAYLDSDDRWFPEHLAIAASTIRQQQLHALHMPMLVDRGVGRFAVKPSRGMSEDEDFTDYRFVEAELVLISTFVISSEAASALSWDERLFFGDVDQYLFDFTAAFGSPAFVATPTALYDDATGPEKLSQLWVDGADTAPYRNFLTWADENRAAFSDKAWTACQVRCRAGLQPGVIKTLGLIFAGYRKGALSLTDAVREFLRARRPTGYRYLIDTFVYLRGQRKADLLTPHVTIDVTGPPIPHPSLRAKPAGDANAALATSQAD